MKCGENNPSEVRHPVSAGGHWLRTGVPKTHCPFIHPAVINPPRATTFVMRYSSWLCVFSLLILTVTSVSANPYEAIVGRNVFGLKPPTLNTAPPPLPPAAATTFKLLGISTILDRRQVMLKAVTAARPPEPAKDKSYRLSEGQGEDEIEVLEIDAVAGTVKIKHHDATLSLDMKVDAEKPAIGAALPGPVLPTPALPGVVPPPNTGLPAPGGGPRTIPTRSLRTSSTDGAGLSEGGATPGSVAANLATQPSNLANQSSVAGQRSVEENVALYEINRAKNEALIQAGVKLPRMPPHVLIQRPAGNAAP